MALEKDQREHMQKTFSGFCDLENQFFNFDVQTKVQLLSNQLQLFQTIATLVMAFLAIVVATGLVKLNAYLCLSALFSITLLFFAVMYTRETIDFQNRNLNDTSIQMKESKMEIIKKIDETLEKDDFSVFNDFIREKVENPSISISNLKEPQYTGEVAVFLFSNGILFGLISIIYPTRDLLLFDNIIIVVCILVISFLVAFTDLITDFTEFVSGLLHKSKIDKIINHINKI